MEHLKWFERNFNFGITQNIFPTIIERLRGTPARLDEKLLFIPENITSINVDGSWSIKENIGHLADLETLGQQRLEDIRQGKPEMTPADLDNAKTKLANHNSKPLLVLLRDFRTIRTETIAQLEQVDEALVFKSSLHPRLKTPMRTMDLFLFVAEHDDHHLARISELIRLLNPKK
jgi:hypothetical protein